MEASIDSKINIKVFAKLKEYVNLTLTCLVIIFVIKPQLNRG
uniref:Uncharacterized protein n=1 Tax=Physcomitrium patens TaxID=3218 RepID=A0A2K1JG69_PHYPA|nr:hypothetical protein PHYPA_017929 [Physcomitrium patens]